MNFDQWFTQQFRDTLREPLAPSDGITASELESQFGTTGLPAAMLAYYRVAGNHWLNKNHNEFRDPASLESGDGYTIFMDENQFVVQWAVRNCDFSEDDPIVYQKTNDPDSEWYSEERTFSQFMIAMWRWILTGEDPDESEG